MTTEPRVYEFVCIDCEIPVTHFGWRAANDQDLCSTCSWIRSIPDPDDRERLRKFLNHTGGPET